MPERLSQDLSVEALASLDGRDYIGQIKARLRNDAGWVVLLDPVLVERTRWGLTTILDSIDRQVERAQSNDAADPAWLRSVTNLQRYSRERLDRMAPQASSRSSTKEARAWRAFSAKLARLLAQSDPEALGALRTPYGDMTALEWLAAREEKAR